MALEKNIARSFLSPGRRNDPNLIRKYNVTYPVDRYVAKAWIVRVVGALSRGPVTRCKWAVIGVLSTDKKHDIHI